MTAARGSMRREARRLFARAEGFRPQGSQLPLPRVGGHDQPSVEVSQHKLGQRSDPERMLVEAGNEMEILPAGADESLPAVDRDFLERLETVGDESGTGNVDSCLAVLRESEERIGEVGLEPAGLPEPRLESGAAPLRGAAE